MTLYDFLIPELLVTGISGFIFFVAGIVISQFPPKKINVLYGYRTKRSMKNQQNWDYAQKYSARKMIETGIVLQLIAAISIFFDIPGGYKILVELILIAGGILRMTVKVEQSLRRYEQTLIKASENGGEVGYE